MNGSALENKFVRTTMRLFDAIFLSIFFSRVHATLSHSVGRSVCQLVCRSVAECSEHATYGDRPCFHFCPTKLKLILFYKRPLFLAEPGRPYENPKFDS